MKKTVLYFTRTGNGKRIAEKIAKGIGTKTMQITDDKKWSGVIGYIRGGFYAVKDKDVNINIKGNYKESEQYIVVSPLWAGGPAPAVRKFIKTVGNDKVILVLNCAGSNVQESIAKFQGKNGKLKGCYGIMKNKKNEDECISEIIKMHRV